MYDSITFFLDRHGVYHPKGITITAKMMNASTFEVYSENSERWNALRIVRVIRSVKNDPYNDDGRPATLLLSMLNYQIDLDHNELNVIGIERGNLLYAGSVLEPCSTSFGKKLGKIEVVEMKAIQWTLPNRYSNHRFVGRPVQLITLARTRR